jgi:hypothetical protein
MMFVPGLVRGQRGVPTSSAIVMPSHGGLGPPGACCGNGFMHGFPGRRPGHFARTPQVLFFSSYFDDYDFVPAPTFSEIPIPVSPRSAEPVVASSAADVVVKTSPGAKLIELPAQTKSRSSSPENNPASEKIRPTVFLLLNGQRVEAQRYTITGDYVYVVTGRRHGTRIPIDNLDVAATINANRGNGIELRIPSVAGELFISY